MLLGNCRSPIQLQLTYAFDWDLIKKIPIELSFNESKTFSTSPTSQLYLYQANITMNINYFAEKQGREKIVLGLAYPSDFISAVAATYGISYESV
jgi:hypothetical protein